MRAGPTVGLAFSTELVLAAKATPSTHLVLMSLLPRQAYQHREEHRRPMRLSPHTGSLTRVMGESETRISTL